VVDLPQPDSPTTPSVSPSRSRRITPSTARTTLRFAPQPPALKCLTRLWAGRWRTGAHAFTSMAERSPSLSMLKEIEVRKIITPGSAATQGCT
jgi:hypothetical protein